MGQNSYPFAATLPTRITGCICLPHRAAVESHQAELNRVRTERDSAQAGMQPLRKRLAELEAAAAAHQAELERVGALADCTCFATPCSMFDSSIVTAHI